MDVKIFDNKPTGSEFIAKEASKIIDDAVNKNGFAVVVFATGMTFISVYEKLTKINKNWDKVIAFHLDEYVGININHKASFKKYLIDNIVNKVNKLKQFNAIDGSNNPSNEVQRISELINNYQVDLLFAGVGNNGHLAFNEPPADFNTSEAYYKVELDKITKDQQFSQGWFNSYDEVPKYAISMTVPQILKSKKILAAAFGDVKVKLVNRLLNDYKPGEVDENLPVSALLNHMDTTLILDLDAAAEIKK